MTCPNCQAVNQAGARFCFNCGTPLTARRPVEGERRVVSIMFADVVDSTSLAASVDPEVWAELMNGALGFMIEAVTRYDGTVGRLMGDAILALFGAPIAHEDDAIRAVRAAIDLRDAAAAYAQVVARDHGLGFAVRIGITTGLSVLATVGDVNKSEYTAMGDSANLAARLQALAPPQGILIGPDTNALVEHAFDTVAGTPQAVKGMSEMVTSYLVRGPRAVEGSARGLAGLASPLVGRDAEVAHLRELLSRARGGQGGLVFLAGDPGLGKSRLVAELKTWAEHGTVWLEARGMPYSSTTPYHPWRQLFTADLPRSGAPGVQQGDGAEEALDEAAATVIALLSGTLDQQAGTGGPVGLDTAADRVADAVSAYLRPLAAAGTVVLVLEDLHWFDRSSTALLEAVAPDLAGRGVLMLGLLRNERGTPAWNLLQRAREGGWPVATTAVLDIAPLERGSAVELLDGMLDVDGMPQATRALILDKAEGNPFYLEEVVRSLIDSGHIVTSAQGWRLAVPIGEVDVPDTLSGVLSARIDRLPEHTRRVALTASVIGRAFDSGLLSAVMREAPSDLAPDLEPDLATLTDEDLLNRLQLVDFDYRFKHELTKDAAYQRLLLRRRRELHGRVASEMERRHPDRLAELARTLAHHYLAGELWHDGARHALVAARQAVNLNALPDALESFEAALDALARLEAQGAAAAGSADERGGSLLSEQYVDALVGWINASVFFRSHEDMELRPLIVARGEEAVARARALGDDRRLTAALVALGNVHALSGFPATGFASLLEAHETARRLGDDQLFLLPFWAATEMLIDDDPAGAVKQFEEVIELARRVGNKGIEAHALGSTVMALGRLGEFEEAASTARLALQVARDSGSTIKEADVNILVGSAYLDMGLEREAFDHAEHGTKLAMSVGGKECTSSGLQLLGTIERRRRNLAEAGDRLVDSIELGKGTAYEPMAYNAKGLLASTEVLRGLNKTVTAIEQELDNAEALRDGFGAAGLRLELASALVELGQATAAAPHVAQAIQWYRQRLMYPYLVRALRLSAAVSQATGADEAAGAARQEADELEAALDETVPASPSLAQHDALDEQPRSMDR